MPGVQTTPMMDILAASACCKLIEVEGGGYRATGIKKPRDHRAGFARRLGKACSTAWCMTGQVKDVLYPDGKAWRLPGTRQGRVKPIHDRVDPIEGRNGQIVERARDFNNTWWPLAQGTEKIQWLGHADEAGT